MTLPAGDQSEVQTQISWLVLRKEGSPAVQKEHWTWSLRFNVTGMDMSFHILPDGNNMPTSQGHGQD